MSDEIHYIRPFIENGEVKITTTTWSKASRALLDSTPMSTGDAVEWINEARAALYVAAGVIEKLSEKKDELNEACEALALLNGILIDKAQIEHVVGCDQDDHDYIHTTYFDCSGCELKALIRFVNDYEQLPDWPNSNFLHHARQAHLPPTDI